MPADKGAARAPCLLLLRAVTGSWRTVGYHGDSMLRPIASYEVAWLARLLVGLSSAFNNTLGLSATPQPPTEEPPETIVQVGDAHCCQG